MSYDLYFYKRKGQHISEIEIGNNLTKNLTSVHDSGKQWFFQNEDTQVYFSFDYNDPKSELESEEVLGNFKDFDNSHFTFNLRGCFDFIPKIRYRLSTLKGFKTL